MKFFLLDHPPSPKTEHYFAVLTFGSFARFAPVARVLSWPL